MLDRSPDPLMYDKDTETDANVMAVYGSLLYAIHDCDNYHQLQTLADDYITLYKALSQKRRYADHEKEALSHFFCECDAYAPDDDEIWDTEDARDFINSAQLKKVASETLQKLDLHK